MVQAEQLGSGMEGRERERKAWLRLFAASCVFTVPVFLLAMVFSYVPQLTRGLSTNVGGFTVNELVQWVLTTPVQVCPTHV